MSSSSFTDKVTFAHQKVSRFIRETCTEAIRADWAFSRPHKELMNYHINECIDGIPVDWFIRGSLPEYNVPSQYIGKDKFAILDDCGLEPILKIADRIAGRNFRVFIEIVKNGTYISVLIAPVRIGASAHFVSCKTNLIDRKQITNVRKHYKNGVKPEIRKPKRGRIEPALKPEPSSIIEQCKILLELGEKYKQMIEKSSPPVNETVHQRTERFLNSLIDN